MIYLIDGCLNVNINDHTCIFFVKKYIVLVICFFYYYNLLPLIVNPTIKVFSPMFILKKLECILTFQ